MNLKTNPLLRLITAAVLLAASSSAMAQGGTSNLKFQFVSATATNTSGTNCPPTNPCTLQSVLGQSGSRTHGPVGRANTANAYLVAAGTYKVAASFLGNFGLALFYGGFPADFAGVGGQTDQLLPVTLAARDLKNNVTVLSGDLNDNGVVDAGDAASVLTFTSHGQYSVFDGFHIEGATESVSARSS